MEWSRLAQNFCDLSWKLFIKIGPLRSSVLSFLLFLCFVFFCSLMCDEMSLCEKVHVCNVFVAF